MWFGVQNSGRAWVLLGALLVAGCGYSWQSEVRRHAATEHGCPEGDIQIVSDNDNRLERHVQLDVCGAPRHYVHTGAGGTYVWEDVTDDDNEAESGSGR